MRWEQVSGVNGVKKVKNYMKRVEEDRNLRRGLSPEEVRDGGLGEARVRWGWGRVDRGGVELGVSMWCSNIPPINLAKKRGAFPFPFGGFRRAEVAPDFSVSNSLQIWKFWGFWKHLETLVQVPGLRVAVLDFEFRVLLAYEQAEALDVSKEMELDLIKQHKEVRAGGMSHYQATMCDDRCHSYGCAAL